MKFGDKNGYATYTDADGRVRFTHRRVAEKELGGLLPAGDHVHHINGRKRDNRSANLVVLNPSIHARVHAAERRNESACFRCGRTGHAATNCYAKSDFKGRSLSAGSKAKTKKKSTTRSTSVKATTRSAAAKATTRKRRATTASSAAGRPTKRRKK